MKMKMTEGEKKFYKERQKINLIRQRNSYTEYKQLLLQIENSSPGDILILIYKIQDRLHKFGYRRISEFAYESIEQVIKDREGEIF